MEATAQPYTQLAAQARREELILSHLGMVRHIIGKVLIHLPRGVDVENLESAGTLGLVEAATSYDPDRGSQFKTFAYLRIRGAVLDELRRNCPLPQHMLDRVARVRKVHKDMPAPVTIEALAAATNMTEAEVADCLAAMRITRMLSWDKSCELLGTHLDHRQERPEAAVEREEEKEQLAQAITSLPERERLVVTLYYMEDLRLKEIGQVLQLSESRVSRVLQAALLHLEEYLRAREAKQEAGHLR